MIYVLVDLFGLVFVTTGGGPGRTTTPVDYMIYLKAFEQGQLGAASALAVILLMIVFTCSWFQIRLHRSGEPVTAGHRVVRWAIAGMLAILAFLALYPLFFMAINTLKSPQEFRRDPLGLPTNW